MESSAEVLAEIRKMRADAKEQQSRAGADTVSQKAAPDATIQPDSTAGAPSAKLDAQQKVQADDELARFSTTYRVASVILFVKPLPSSVTS